MFTQGNSKYNLWKTKKQKRYPSSTLFQSMSRCDSVETNLPLIAFHLRLEFRAIRPACPYFYLFKNLRINTTLSRYFSAKKWKSSSCVCSNLRMDGNPSSFGPANRRPPEERNAHNWFLQKIMRSHNGCDNCLNERATKQKSANSQSVRNFFLRVRFPRGYLFWPTLR